MPFLSHLELKKTCEKCWMEALNTTELPKEDEQFLMRGGNCHAAKSLITKLRQLCKVDIHIVDLMTNPIYNEFQKVLLNAKPLYDTATENNDFCCLSTAQKRILVLHEYAPSSTAYVESAAITTRITSKKSVQGAVEQLLAIHPELNTEINLISKSGEYVRNINPYRNIDVCFEIIQDELDIADYITKSIPTIKMLSSPLIKCRCLQSQYSNTIVFHIHSIIVDEVTMGEIVKNFIKILKKQNINSAPLSYSDYITSEEHYLTSAEYAEDELFWREKYHILPPVTTLSVMPLSEATWRETVAYTAQNKFKEFETANNKEISQTIEDMEITEFIYYLACTSLILHRYVGVDDIVMAIPVSVREDPWHRITDGLFLNTLLFRSSYNAESTFREHISKIAIDWRLAEKAKKYPLDRLAEWMLTTQEKGISSLCSIMFNYSMTSPAVEEKKILSKHAKMPLMIKFLVNQRTGIKGVLLEWAEELLDRSIVLRLLDSISSLCSQNIPLDRRITNLEVLSTSELSILRSFSSGNLSKPHRSGEKMHIQFEHNAKKYPENIAVVFDQKSITYKVLNQIASRIAHRITSIISFDILRENPVILFSEKDILAIAMLIGVWKSGGYFLPVSVSNKSILKDTAGRFTAAMVIHHCNDDDYKTLLEANFTCPMIRVQDMLDYTYDDFLWSNTSKNQSNTTAYALRTSGTTGVPKSFRISHHSLNVISDAWKIAYNMETYQMNVFQWVLFSFGVFMNDMVRALISVPGTLIICPDNKRLDVVYVQKKIKQHNVSFIEVTPHFASYLFENAKMQDFSSIKIFILSSDVVHSNVFHKVQRFLRPDQRVVNGYGMTEATNDSTYFEGIVLPSTRSDTVPVGKPLPGIQIHVCDPKTLLPTPVGTVGEVYISGGTIASGEVKIVTLGSGRGVALKTGDLGCWLPCGNLEIMGRSDYIVKFRGFRISTAEIEEQILKRVPGIRETCVNVLVDNTQDKMQYLCAYVVADSMHRPSPTTLRQILSNELPYYMIPDIIHFCESLPETIYGKIDKKAIFLSEDLANQHLNRCKDGANETGEDTKTMKTLKQLFAKAMNIGNANFVQTNLTFRENGASSFVLVRFCALIENEMNCRITIADLCSYTSFSGLLSYIDQMTQLNLKNNFDANDSIEADDIAITGVGVRLPCGIESLSQLWEVLEKGEDLIDFFPDNRSRDVKTCSKIIPGSETYKGAFLNRIDNFDNEFFNISAEEAKLMSPEQRLFLEVATESLLEARNICKVDGANIGVFLSTLDIGYSRLNYPKEANSGAGMVPGMVATRIAYQWNLKGPCFLVDTACSSSLMALKLASESIKRNECEGALVGGVNICIYPDSMENYGDAEIYSPDFCCRSFDENANGTVLGEGVLCLHIEKLSTALKQRKHVYGIVKSVVSASVGRGNGITAPSAISQETAIRAALKAANVQIKDVHYIETHGSGTKLGDSIEVSALSSIFNNSNDDILKIGTSKSMFGSLDTASGLLGVVKVLTAFMFNMIPPSANFKTPIKELKDSSLSVVSDVHSWKRDTYGRRIAGVNAFGLTGISCHTIISDFVSMESERQEITNLTFVPLLFRGKSFNHIKRQAHHYSCLIRETVQKRQLNTLEGLCYVVATKLWELSNAELGHKDFRMVISVKTIEQVLELLSLIQLSVKSEDISSISNARGDIHISFPEMSNVTTDMKYIRSFLCDDHIDTYAIFGGGVKNIKPAFGITISIYEENRHWLDPSGERRLQQTGISQYLDKKLPENKYNA